MGVIRFDIKRDRAILSIGFLQKYCGLGYGRFFLQMAIKQLFARYDKISRIEALVKKDNFISQKFFESFGFICQSEVIRRKQKAYKFIYEKNTY